MIKEAYCSFEVSKLLREKGFDEPCMKVWTLDDCRESETIWSINFSEGNLFVTNKEIDAIIKEKIFLDAAYLCPTQELVCRWLREEKKIFIEPFVSIDLNGKYHFCFRLLNSECKDILQPKDLINIDFKDSYEEAIEAALKYCLTKLI